MQILPSIQWQDAAGAHCAYWRSEAGLPPPSRIVPADDTLRADAAYRLASEGTALLWQGDFQNARQLLQAMQRRMATSLRKVSPTPASAASPISGHAADPAAFHRYRMQQAQRARTLGRLLIPLNADHTIPLRRAPDVRAACLEAFGESDGNWVVSLRELQGAIGAHEWREKGIMVSALGARIHPHFGVFAPVRDEYVDLAAQAPLPACALAFDIGTGSGVLAALLARRGVRRVVATDNAPRALACARDNIARLGLDGVVSVVEADLFPDISRHGRAALIVCNPPWLPGKPASLLEQAVYDPDSRMLCGFLDGLAAHLAVNGEGWLVLSDLAEHLGLRSRETLLAMIDAAGLRVIERHDIRPRHPRASDRGDPLHAARAREVTSLWRLSAARD